jgi:hypothetical protein
MVVQESYDIRQLAEFGSEMSGRADLRLLRDG